LRLGNTREKVFEENNSFYQLFCFPKLNPHRPRKAIPRASPPSSIHSHRKRPSSPGKRRSEQPWRRNREGCKIKENEIYMRTWENLFAPDTMVTLFAARQSIIPHPLNPPLHCMERGTKPNLSTRPSGMADLPGYMTGFIPN